MPELGDGILGRHLLAQSVRLGPGEFHSLREYVPGDEPRTIHWRASARSDELKVRQHTAEGLRRCTVVLDQQVPGDVDDRTAEVHADAFERAVVAAASLVHSADRAGLRDPLRHHVGRRPPRPDRGGPHDAPPRPGDARPASAATRSNAIRVKDSGWCSSSRRAPTPRPGSTMGELRDPSLTLLGVFTEHRRRRAAEAVRRRPLRAALLDAWEALVGRRRSSRRSAATPTAPPGPPSAARARRCAIARTRS